MLTQNMNLGNFYHPSLSGWKYTVFYKNSCYKNHQAQNCQKIKNILRIMARLKYIIKNLESPILILHQELVLFTMECLLLTMEGLQFFSSCFALRQNAFTILWDFLFYILCNSGKFKRNYEYNLSLIYKVPIWVTF